MQLSEKSIGSLEKFFPPAYAVIIVESHPLRDRPVIIINLMTTNASQANFISASPTAERNYRCF